MKKMEEIQALTLSEICNELWVCHRAMIMTGGSKTSGENYTAYARTLRKGCTEMNIGRFREFYELHKERKEIIQAIQPLLKLRKMNFERKVNEEK